MERKENSRESSGKIETTEEYWDCECKHNFIHPKTQKTCPICGANSEEMPDSRVNEVIRCGLPLKVVQ